MESFNQAFKGIAEKMGLPAFFKSNTLLFNNLFLTLVAVVLIIALILVIVLVPNKKKNKKQESPAANDASEKSEAESEPAAEKPAVESKQEPTSKPEQPQTAPKKEEAPAEQPQKQTPPLEKAPAPDKKEEPVKSSGKYEIVKKRGSFYFLLKANNGQLLLESSGYTTEQGARNGIDTFKNAVESGEFKIDEDKNGNFKFILRASARSQMIYSGEAYGSRQRAESAVESVKNFAFKAAVKRVEENDDDEASEIGAVVETKPLKEEDHKLGGKYEIEERDGNYYFLLKANNGQLLVESPAFTTEQGAKSGIETFKKAAESGIFVIDKDKNDKFRFILRASARSQLRYLGESYSTRQSAENSVASVRSFAQKAVLK